MKFNCSGPDLSQAAGIVGKMLSGKSNIPVLDGINIKAAGKKVTLSVYNQEVYIQKTINAEIFEEGEIVVEGKLFIDYTNKISGVDRVEIEVLENEKLSVKFGYSEFEMPYYEKENFPELGECKKELYFSIKENQLKELIDRALYCISINTANTIILRSCSFTVKNNTVETVCLDGFRIAVSKKNVISQNGDISFIVYGKHLSDIMKILSDNDEEISVSVEKRMILFDLGHTKIKVSTVEGEFFKYEQIIPKDIKNEIIVKKDDLSACLERAAVICKDTAYNKITLTVEEKMINIFALSEKGKINENIECKNSGENIKIAFNCKFIQDAISKIKEDYLKINIERSAKPVLITPMDGEEYKCVVLPLKLVG